MSYEDKLALAQSLKRKAIRLAPADSALLEIKDGLEKIVDKDSHNTQQLIESLSKLTETLEAQPQPTDNREYLEALGKAFESIQQEIKSIVIPEIPPSIKVEGLEDLIKKLIPTKASPSVRVVLKDDDIYSRYKRVNSSLDNGITYHGFADQNANWFIQKEATTAKGASSRYAVGNGNFSAAWNKRSALDYLPFYEVSIP